LHAVTFTATRRGWIGIYQNAKFEVCHARWALDNPYCRDFLADAGFKTLRGLPLGKVIAVAEIVDSVPLEMLGDLETDMPRHEREFNDFFPPVERVLVLAGARLLKRPVAASGRGGCFWRWNECELPDGFEAQRSIELTAKG
jgi:hypothetical protein